MNFKLYCGKKKATRTILGMLAQRDSTFMVIMIIFLTKRGPIVLINWRDPLNVNLLRETEV